MRAVGRAPASGSRSARLVTQADIESLPPGGRVETLPGCLVTPLARQAALERGIRIGESESRPVPIPERRDVDAGARSVALAADHGGYAMKLMLLRHLADRGHEVVDCGTDDADPVDYPDFALAVARLVAEGRAWRGIVVDGAGIGSCMAANKVPGVRAAMCYDEATAVNSREHNDANVLTLGAGLIGPALARRIVDTWLDTPAAGGRHARRVEKIMDIERRYAAQ